MGKRRKRARRALASRTPIVMAPKAPPAAPPEPVVEKPAPKKSAFIASAPPKATSPKKSKKVTRSVHPDQQVQEAKKTTKAAAKPVKTEDAPEAVSSEEKEK
jgi:hypothetical protein|tara:strand:+ start:367 stop:672 length:306 start_codon:yes stop_codon:yes gene_type:complete